MAKIDSISRLKKHTNTIKSPVLSNPIETRHSNTYEHAALQMLDMRSKWESIRNKRKCSKSVSDEIRYVFDSLVLWKNECGLDIGKKNQEKNNVKRLLSISTKSFVPILLCIR